MSEINDIATAYLAPEGLEKQTSHWLKDITALHGRLIIANGSEQFCPFAQNVWRNPKIINFSSIADGAAQLKAVQRNWYPYSFQLHRRTSLIQEKLPFIKTKALDFPAKPLTAPLGSFTLLSETSMLASSDCSSLYPNGEPEFVENHIDPPSRAYMKLFEAFTVLCPIPKKTDTCLELGAAPGGWTWVLAKSGAKIIAVDRAELDPRVKRLPGVHYQAGDAFAMSPEKTGPIDWLISDIICYPEKLFDFISHWLKAGTCRNYLLTLKFQGETNYDIIEKFAAIKGSRLMHLSANKHELTWYHSTTANQMQLLQQ